MLRRTYRLLFIFCLVVPVGVLSACFYLTTMLMNPGHWKCKETHNVFCGDPSSQALIFESFETQSSDGFKISGWWMPAEKSKSVIILSHGRGNDRHEGMRFATALVENGFNVVAFDYRNSGKSTSSFNSLGFYEKWDLEAILDYVKKRGFESIGVYGFSQGAAIAIAVMASDLGIKAGVFEGAFSSAVDVLAEKARSDYFLPRFPIVDLAIAFFKYRTGADLKRVDPGHDIPRIFPRPIYLVHSKGDRVVRFHHAERLLLQAPQAETWFFDDNRHVQSWQFERTTAERKVIDFFRRALGVPVRQNP